MYIFILIIKVILTYLIYYILKNICNDFKKENFFSICNNKITKKNIIEIDNIYDKNLKLKWIDYNNLFMKINQPNNIIHDFEIKKDIINKALKLKKNTCIIDCGAHIGDGAIPIAQVLQNNDRNDIIIYAIDPSKDKCDFIEFIANENNLKNIKVLNYGLSDNNKLHYQNLPKDNNSGGSVWLLDKVNMADNANNYNIKESLNFIKLDTLISKKIIKEKLGIIHLDVEGMEDSVIKGGIQNINKDKPYLTLEDNDNNKKEVMLNLLNNYKFVKRIYSNNIYEKIENNI